MCCRLTPIGVIWALLSLISSLLNSTGYYLPFWIKGQLHGTDVYLGSFRRCNYPTLTREGKFEIVHECGRYTTFGDIPSLYWQITTIVVGVAAAISLLVSFTAFSGCCMSDVITKGTARALGLIQLLAGVLMVAGGAAYPYGWESPEVRDVCGHSRAYHLGTCELSLSTWMMAAGTGGLFLCFILSFGASKVKLNPRNERPIQRA